MDTPRGLRKPRRIAALVPIVVAIIGVLAVIYFGLQHLMREGFVEDPDAAQAGAATAGYAPAHFQPEIFYGLGALALLIALARGVWRTQSRRGGDRPDRRA